jgi:RHS repeat-associated protein
MKRATGSAWCCLVLIAIASVDAVSDADSTADPTATLALISTALPRTAARSQLVREADRVTPSRGTPSRTPLHPSIAGAASGTTQLALEGAAHPVLEITPADRADVPGVIEDGALIFSNAEPDTDIVVTAGDTWLEEARVLRSKRAPRVATYRLRAGASVSEVRLRGGSVEVMGHDGSVLLRSEPAFAVDAAGTRRALEADLHSDPNGDRVLALALDTRGLTYPIVVDPSWVTGTSWPTETLVALTGMWLQPASGASGSVAVIDSAPGALFPPPTVITPTLTVAAELLADIGASVNASAVTPGSVKAHRILLQATAHVAGDAYYNQLTALPTSSIGGATHTPLILPVPITVPAMPTITVGTTDVLVNAGTTTTLAPGSYRFIELKTGTASSPAVLRLAGTYHMAFLHLDDFARIECTAACELRVQGQIHPGASTYVGSAASAPTVTPADITIFASTLGSSPPELDPDLDIVQGLAMRAAAFGSNSTVHARVFVPNGLLWFKDGVSASGRFAAHDVLIGPGAIVKRDCDSVDDGDVCTQDACDFATGTALHTPLTATACDDGNACTQTDTCQSGTCTGSNPVTCTPLDQCHDIGTCNTSTGVCTNPLKADGASCNDGDGCMQTDTCQGGTCTGSNPVTCTALDQCHDAGTCNPSTGVCSNPSKPNGTSCNDSDACTLTDTCQSGTCTGSSPVQCQALDQCHDVGTCNPATGVCSNPNKPNGTSCTDSDACTQTDTCESGACTGSSPVECHALDQCHDVGSCNPATGVCSNPNKPNGTSCTTDLCLEGQTCTAGSCGGGAPVQVDDGIACTIDTCDPATGVKHRACSTIDRTVVTNLYEASKFLFTGNDPIQTGVSQGVVDPLRVTVLRGKVKTAAGSPLMAVTIRVLKDTASSPDYGQTVSAADGFFTMAANGGGELRVSYAKTGYLPVERRVSAAQLDYTELPDVVMIPPDAASTVVDTSGAAGMQVHRATAITDASGSRQATVLFPAGTTAQLILPNGSGQSVSQLTVRASELTVGASGPEAMPLTLPPTSGYTYAVNLDADEAVSAGATRIQFNQPVLFYLENFLGFAVGTHVPHGTYAKSSGCWKAETDGRVIKILDVQGGAAVLDTDGDGLADDAATLLALGIDSAELVKLSALYSAGQTLWRVATSHFSSSDPNWPNGCQDPPCEPPPQPKPKPPKDPKCDSQDDNASTILCERQTLLESVPIAGTPFTLSYASDRAPDRLMERAHRAVLTNASVPSTLKRIELDVDIAGKRFSQTFVCPSDCQANKTYDFVWDGNDVFGRLLQGPQRGVFTIRYAYQGVYNFPANEAASFALSGLQATPVPTRADWLETTSYDATLGTSWDGRPVGLGGWSLDVHQVYDPATRTLHQGNGRERTTDMVGSGIRTIAGGQPPNAPLGDGGPATAANLAGPRGMRVAADGTIYFADDVHQRVRKIAPSGIISTVAGTGTSGFAGDGGAAISAELATPRDVALAPDGTLCIADYNNQRVRCVDKSTGVITTVAGNGQRAYAGDGGPATAASLIDPGAVAFGPDCALYIGEWNHVRRVGPNGIITTVAGGGANNPPGKAIEMFLGYVGGLAFAPDGSLYISDSGSTGSFMRVLRVTPDGNLRLFAGTGSPGDTGDGGPAVDATLHTPGALAVGHDGSVYVQVELTDPGPPAAAGIRRIGPDGVITRFTGSNALGCANNNYCGENGPVEAAHLLVPAGVAAGPVGDRSIYITDHNGRLLRAQPPMPGIALADIVVPSKDGQEVFVFTSAGKHKETRDGVTGAVRYAFGYDVAGRLATITDVSGLVTTIAYDGAGNPTKITGPFGQETLLAIDANGYIATITDPASQSTSWSYTAGGLLTGRTDARNFATSYSYDAFGRFASVTDATTALRSFSRTESAAGYTVTRTTPEGRVTTFASTLLGDGTIRFAHTPPFGLATTTDHRVGVGITTTTAPTGELLSVSSAPDPRFGLLTPLTTSTTQTPLGLTRQVTEERIVTLVDPNDPLHPNTILEKTTVNGKTTTRSYDASTKVWTITTPMGRTSTMTLDAVGRTTQSATSGITAVSFGYDAQGRLITTTQGTRQTTLGYDTSGWLATTTDALTQTTAFTRDAVGRVTVTTRPDTETIGQGYDGNGNVTSVTPPGKPAHAMSHTPVNLLADYLPPNVGFSPRDTQWAYNEDRQVTNMLRPDNLSLAYGYDTAGRLATLTAPTDTRTYGYSSITGQLLSISGSAVTLAYAYDGSLVTSLTWSGAVSGSVQFEHDNDFRVSVEKVNAGGPISIQYDLDSLVSQAGDLTIGRGSQNALITGTTLDQISDSYAYSGFGELGTYEADFQASTILYKTVFERDALGRITKKTETIGGTITVYDYEYDLAGRLKKVKENGSVARQYTYDANGNRLTKVDSGGTTSGAYDNQDRLLTYGQHSYTYTPAGELASKFDAGTSQTTSYSYDAFGNLASVTLPNSDVITYVADPENRRVQKKLNGVVQKSWLYKDALRPIAELDAANNVVSRFVYALGKNVPDYMIKAGVKYRLVTDQVGSVRLVVNAATGAVAQRLDYDEFGIVTSDTAPGFQPFGFAGGLYDPDTGLVRFGARDYDALTGRWTAKDPLYFSSGDSNLFVYVNNDAVNATDPTGRKTKPGPIIHHGQLVDCSDGDVDGYIDCVIGVCDNAPLSPADYAKCQCQCAAVYNCTCGGIASQPNCGP